MYIDLKTCNNKICLSHTDVKTTKEIRNVQKIKIPVVYRDFESYEINFR
jgi:hypothetical protein